MLRRVKIRSIIILIDMTTRGCQEVRRDNFKQMEGDEGWEASDESTRCVLLLCRFKCEIDAVWSLLLVAVRRSIVGKKREVGRGWVWREGTACIAKLIMNGADKRLRAGSTFRLIFREGYV